MQNSGFELAVYNQQKYSTANGNNQAAKIKAGDPAESNRRADKTTANGARNTQNNGHKNTAWIFAGHQQLGNNSHDQSQDDP